MEIRCKKLDCLYNKAQTCAADGITVFRCGACGTYTASKEKQKQIDDNPAAFEFSGDLVPAEAKNVPLFCKAGICLFNRAGACAANGIAVIGNDNMARADCATFIEK